MTEYKVIKSTVLFDQRMTKIVVDTLEYDGIQRPYFYLASRIEAVATVGLTANGEIILTRQYRHPIRQVIYDLPAGALHPGEKPLDGARREFEEETGFFPAHIELLGYFNQFPGTLRAGTHLFFASQLKATQQKLDEGEILETVLMPASKVLELIKQGEFMDGSLQLGVLLAWQKGLLPS